jgi:hypothetical protein
MNTLTSTLLKMQDTHLSQSFKSSMNPSNHSAENSMLRTELEMLMKERENLLIIAGAAAGLIAELNTHDLPIRTVEAADLLATTINKLSEETLQDALNSVHASIDN